MTPKRVVVTGASGLIGSAVVAALRSRGDTVVILSRSSLSQTGAVWSPSEGVMDERVLESSDAVICLNGAGIGDKRWSDDRKRVLLSSRVDAVGCIAKTLAAMDDPPGTFISASAIGIYGDPINIAARMEQTAKRRGLECVLSNDVVSGLSGVVDPDRFNELGEEQVKGISRPIPIFQLLR